MAEEKKPVEENIVPPLNPADPIVIFDPFKLNSNIVTMYEPSEEDPKSSSNKDNNLLKQDAVRVPLIKLNNTNLTHHKIKSFNLAIKGFLPTIKLEIKDSDKLIQGTDTPGMNNCITVIMIAPVNGANKKISIDFYITKCTFENNIATYYGEYKCIDLNRELITQLGDKQLTTYECFLEVAKLCNLGFASSYGCHDVNDARWRQIYKQTYKDFVINQLSFGGLNEDSVFDAWIDQFGYLTIVNLSKIFNDNTITYKNLVTRVTGGETTTASITELPNNEVKLVNRVITNDKTSGIHNLRFDRYETIVNNEEQINKGTLRTLYYMDDACNKNKINFVQVQVIENSVDGINNTSDYEFTTSEFIGVEMHEDNPILVQKVICESFKQKHFSKLLYVELPKPNYNLQRGMLLNVILKEYEPGNKRIIIDNYKNAFEKQPSDDLEKKDVGAVDAANSDVINDYVGVDNPSLSGLYYIHMIGFKWNQGYTDIKQYLYLSPKGIMNNIFNKTTKPQV